MSNIDSSRLLTACLLLTVFVAGIYFSEISLMAIGLAGLLSLIVYHAVNSRPWVPPYRYEVEEAKGKDKVAPKGYYPDGTWKGVAVGTVMMVIGVYGLVLRNEWLMIIGIVGLLVFTMYVVTGRRRRSKYNPQEKLDETKMPPHTSPMRPPIWKG
jgi:drug/metabolite transporter (DMT)-like permease